MIFEFKCRATGTIVMNEGPAKWLIGVIGKEAGPQGIVTVEQMPAAIAAIRKAVAEEKAAIRDAHREGRREGPDEEAGEEEGLAYVSNAQRAQPFLEMLEAALRAGREITWGV